LVFVVVVDELVVDMMVVSVVMVVVLVVLAVGMEHFQNPLFFLTIYQRKKHLMSDLTLWETTYSIFGLNNPVQRFLTTYVLVSGIIYVSNSEFFFGNEEEGEKGYLPWWSPGLALGLMSALFI
jgi:hypothetical protein